MHLVLHRMLFAVACAALMAIAGLPLSHGPAYAGIDLTVERDDDRSVAVLATVAVTPVVSATSADTYRVPPNSRHAVGFVSHSSSCLTADNRPLRALEVAPHRSHSVVHSL